MHLCVERTAKVLTTRVNKGKDQAMKKLGDVLDHQFSTLVQQNKAAAYSQYIARVQHCYKSVIERVFQQSSELILNHTNNVIVKKEHNALIGTIFVDESIYAAELNAHREIILLLFAELGNIALDQVRISVSRGTFKNHHPFAELLHTDTPPNNTNLSVSPATQKEEITSEQYNTFMKQISAISDKRLQMALKDAISQSFR